MLVQERRHRTQRDRLRRRSCPLRTDCIVTARRIALMSLACREASMIRTILAALAACLVASGASANDDHCRYTANCDYEIRERLLGIPVWIFEMTRAQRLILTGEVRFEKRGYKLFALSDTGMKC